MIYRGIPRFMGGQNTVVALVRLAAVRTADCRRSGDAFLRIRVRREAVQGSRNGPPPGASCVTLSKPFNLRETPGPHLLCGPKAVQGSRNGPPPGASCVTLSKPFNLRETTGPHLLCGPQNPWLVLSLDEITCWKALPKKEL